MFSLLNYLGILKALQYFNEIFYFTSDMVAQQKGKHIDSDHPLTFTEAMLHKIQQTSEKNHPFHGDLGELNLINTLEDFFMAGSGM